MNSHHLESLVSGLCEWRCRLSVAGEFVFRGRRQRDPSFRAGPRVALTGYCAHRPNTLPRGCRFKVRIMMADSSRNETWRDFEIVKTAAQ